ncbi:hypothetical protein SAMN05421853_10855 [Roseivivax halotolerans]|jgi:hypothetical protein|uniref:Uncharacterized protein n=1 Tax=Roseivivax halotolerans TaxID=93684 RepID=A0A1I5Z762_9RHOB|nr:MULTISPECIES: hypothetical protein [Roseivivax]QFT62845.1 hypothetical protein FIU91_07925 [Roseivivax sp. THAF30]SFQ52294.1 hypothetical protein SAMN05421853_10855 [Roseivivax halotolerans]
MPVTSFALTILLVIAAAALTVWAMSAFGLLAVMPVLIVLVLALRWGLGHVPFDDSHT